MNRRERITLSSRQRGALAVTTPLLVLLILLLTVLLLDGARLYAAKREMQSQANAAAVAAAFDAQACGGLDIDGDIMSETGLLAAQAHGWREGDGEFTVQHGSVDFQDDGVAVFSPGGDILRSNAVGVSYKRSLPISLLLPAGAFGLNNVEISVSSVARRELIATISGAGSTVVVGGDAQRATVLNALLGALFNDGAPYSFSATSLNDLSDVTVKLGDLLVESGVGGVVNALPVNAHGLALALDGAVGDVSAVGELLDGLLRSGNIASLEGIAIEDVLYIVGDNMVVPENARVPVYDLLVSMAMNVLKDALSEPLDVKLKVGSLAEVSLQLFVDQPPTVVVGPARLLQGGDPAAIEGWETTFDAADLKISLDVELLPDPVLGALANIEIPILIETGSGQGALVAARCAVGSGNLADMYIRWATQAANIRTARVEATGAIVDSEINVTILGLSIPLELDAKVSTHATNDPNPMMMQANLYDISQLDAEPVRRTVGGAVGSIDLSLGSRNAVVELILLILNPLLDAVNDLVLAPLITAIIDPLLQALGVNLGQMGVTVSGVVQQVQLIEGVVYSAEL